MDSARDITQQRVWLANILVKESTEEYQARWKRIRQEQVEEDRRLAQAGIWPRRWG
jgi:hypothetical protein